jgi:hypothetical protein
MESHACAQQGDGAPDDGAGAGCMTELPFTRDPVFGCEIYDGPRDKDGYGRFRGRLAHVVADERRHGPLPPDKELDHACRVRACLADAHLERVSRSENEKRKRWGYRCRRATCPRGHDMRINAMVTKYGGRVCRACSRP